MSGSTTTTFTPPISPVVWLEAKAAYLFQDAGKATPATNGTTVYTWADRSGHGRDFIQATGANRPTATLTSGVLAPYFNLTHTLGGGDLSANFSDGLSDTDGVTLIWRHSIEDATTTASRGSLLTYSLSDGYDRNAGNFSYVHHCRTVRLDAQPIVPLGKNTQTIRSNAAGYSRRLNGTQDITAAANYGGLDLWKIGIGGSSMLQGYFYGLLAFAAQLTDAQCLAVETYLGTLAP